MLSVCYIRMTTVCRPLLSIHLTIARFIHDAAIVKYKNGPSLVTSVSVYLFELSGLLLGNPSVIFISPSYIKNV